MKRFLPILAVAVITAAWFSYLHYKDTASQAYLKQAALGAMSKFVIFDGKENTPQTPVLDREGNSLTFEDFKGTALLVNFWATWCEPCKEEMPTLLHLQNLMEGENFKVLTVSIDWQGYKIIDPFLEENDVTSLTVLWDRSNRLPNQFEVKGLPLTVLIDKKGNWIGRFDGPAEWNSIDAIRLMRTVARE